MEECLDMLDLLTIFAALFWLIVSKQFKFYR